MHVTYDILQYARLTAGIVIVETNIAEFNAALNAFKRSRRRAVLNLQVRIQQLKDARGGGEYTLELYVDPAQFPDWIVHTKQ